jgi:hypothetical protein
MVGCERQNVAMNQEGLGGGIELFHEGMIIPRFIVAKNLGKIYIIAKQNMGLLDTALVQGYGDQFFDESENNLECVNLPNGNSASPETKASPVGIKMKATPAKRRSSRASTDNDIEVEEMDVTSELAFCPMGDSDRVFDLGMLCSVGITADGGSNVSPPPSPPPTYKYGILKDEYKSHILYVYQLQ